MRLIALLLAVCTLPTVFSHTYMLTPRPRSAATRTSWTLGSVTKYPYEPNGQFSPFNKIGWCGNLNTPGAVPASAIISNTILPPALKQTTPLTNQNIFTAGQAINVFWTHPLSHPDPNIGSIGVPIFKYGIRVAVNFSATDMVVLNEPLGPTKSVNAIDGGHIEQSYGYDAFAANDGSAAYNWLPNATFALPPGKTCNPCVLQFWLDAESDGGGYVDCADIIINPVTTIAPIPGTTTTRPPTTAPPAGGTTAAPGPGGATTIPPVNVPVEGPTISPQTLELHNKPADCWTSVRKVVYDISPLVNRHPGGPAILTFCGYESDDSFETQHAAPLATTTTPDRALSKMVAYIKGNLGTAETPGAAGPGPAGTGTTVGTENGAIQQQIQTSMVVIVAALLAVILI